ncbi:putative coiled-coil domain-containing protein [Apostichopus japonicus]|uniref:Putative coiled-coil domain-containing protein n=1 Tax=Stichopus japonicus TaxID=307972 RepID=A0A2G8KCB9_STIJA|nr:putative coiled-coil domain-containing protein [Apostichopus japonicus]
MFIVEGATFTFFLIGSWSLIGQLKGFGCPIGDSSPVRIAVRSLRCNSSQSVRPRCGSSCLSRGVYRYQEYSISDAGDVLRTLRRLLPGPTLLQGRRRHAGRRLQGAGTPVCGLEAPGDQTEAVMTAADIARWRKEGEKDLSRIRAHLSNLMAQINPLKSTLEESKQSCEKLTKTLSDKTHLLSKERTERESQVAQYEIKIKNIEKNHRESMSVVERSYDDLVKGKRKIDEQVVKLKQELVKQCDALKDLDVIKKQLQKSVAENTTMSNQIVRLESDVMEMTEQLKNNHSELEDVNRKLGKEQAKNRSMEKQGQAMQIKHDILAQRTDELDKDCQELRDQLAEAEDHNEDLQNKLQQVQGEREELQSNLQKEKELAETVQKERDFLEKSINDLKDIIISLEDQVKEGQERERLLVQFPERNPTLVPNPGKTGVEERDMKNQVEANSIRMQVLEEENNLLRKNISQLLDGREEEINGPAIPLWQVGTNSRSNEANRFSDVSPRTQERNNLFSAR